MAISDPPFLKTFIDRIKLIPHAQLLLGSGGFAALVIVLHFILRRKQTPNYVTNLAHIGARQYDVIIVGGGTTGCALAARLSEDPAIRVLLLEAGQRVELQPYFPDYSIRNMSFLSEQNLKSMPRVKHASGPERSYWVDVRFSLSLFFHYVDPTCRAQYGAPEDFDEWAKLMNDDSWSWKNFSQYFTKFERYQPHPDYPLVNTAVRGSSGPIRIGYFNTVSETSKAVIKACTSVGIPFSPDFNVSSGTLGVSRIMTYIDEKRQRVSSESAYLTKDVLARKNLTVAVNAQVTRVIFKTENGEKRAIGVQVANSPTGIRYRVLARKEVILCAGAVQSPHILKLSGVGPAEELKAHGISTVHDLPGVGSNLVDHPVVDIFLKDKHDRSLKYLRPKSLFDACRVLFALIRYHLLGMGGPLATNFGESAAFVRSDDPVLFPKEQYPEALLDSTSGPGAPDLELFSTPLAYKEHGKITFDVHTYALHVYLVRPLSTGSVLLRTSNPFDLPIVNPNYLKVPEDAVKLMRGVRLLLKIAQTEPLASYLDQDFRRPDLDHGTHLKSDEEMLELVKERVETVYHPACTCRMAPPEMNGVVDSQLRVYGIHGLRVCDTSVYPWIVSGHTAGACYAMAEKLADILKKSIRD
ncbi:L-sorbose 1-dehydrogenase [Termitomyces sp. J132]|nr:L-sorbose 1-dehydrogenase [Termitomyces sp. J132]